MFLVFNICEVVLSLLFPPADLKTKTKPQGIKNEATGPWRLLKSVVHFFFNPSSISLPFTIWKQTKERPTQGSYLRPSPVTRTCCC